MKRSDRAACVSSQRLHARHESPSAVGRERERTRQGRLDLAARGRPLGTGGGLSHPCRERRRFRHQDLFRPDHLRRLRCRDGRQTEATGAAGCQIICTLHLPKPKIYDFVCLYFIGLNG